MFLPVEKNKWTCGVGVWWCLDLSFPFKINSCWPCETCEVHWTSLCFESTVWVSDEGWCSFPKKSQIGQCHWECFLGLGGWSFQFLLSLFPDQAVIQMIKLLPLGIVRIRVSASYEWVNKLQAVWRVAHKNS